MIIRTPKIPDHQARMGTRIQTTELRRRQVRAFGRAFEVPGIVIHRDYGRVWRKFVDQLGRSTGMEEFPLLLQRPCIATEAKVAHRMIASEEEEEA